jgi:hypothetical protein
MADLQKLFDAAEPRIREVWHQVETQLSKELQYSMFGFRDEMAEIKDTQFEQVSGLGIAGLTGEAEPYNREEKIPGFKTTITPIKFTNSIPITEELIRFTLKPFDKIKDLVGDLGNSIHARIDTNAAKIFYLGHGTTYFTDGSGEALFSTHTLKDGSTQSNDLGAIPLSYDNLKTARQALDRMRDDKGVQLMKTRNLRLIVPNELEERSKEVLRSIGNPDNANRINNVFANGQGSIDLRVADWIPNSSTYNKRWYLIDMDRAARMTRMMWGWKPRFDSDKIINNGTKIYTGSTSFQPGYIAHQWAIGSSATT